MSQYHLNPKGEKYYSQMNNILKPTIRCKPTATIEALDLAGWPLPAGAFKQPEDNLTAYCEAKWGPDAPEDWERIVEAINGYFLAAEKPLTLRYNWQVREALWGLRQGLPFACSTHLTKAGHVVNLVDWETSQDWSSVRGWSEIKVSQIKAVFIDDPYGDRTSGKYEMKSGWNCRYQFSDLLEIWKGAGVQVKRKGV